MELSINGHKVVGGGTVHTVTPIAGSNVTGTIRYCVTNGICVVMLEGVQATNTGNREVCDIPYGKIGAGTPLTTGAAVNAYTYVYTNKLYLDVYVANQGAYGELVYPVADDWHE